MKFKKLYIVGILLFAISVMIYSKLNIGCIKVDSKISEKVSKSEMIFTKNLIYTEKGILFILVKIGDGFSGLNIDIMKMGTFYNL